MELTEFILVYHFLKINSPLFFKIHSKVYGAATYFVSKLLEPLTFSLREAFIAKYGEFVFDFRDIVNSVLVSLPSY